MHLPEMLEHGNLHDIAYTAVDTSFIALNIAVAARQASLTGKIAKKHAKWIHEKDIIPEAQRKKERRARNKKAFAVSALAGIAVGAASQGAVTLSLHDAHDQMMDNKVKEFIQEHADDNDGYESNIVFLPPKSDTQSATPHDAPR